MMDYTRLKLDYSPAGIRYWHIKMGWSVKKRGYFKFCCLRIKPQI